MAAGSVEPSSLWDIVSKIKELLETAAIIGSVIASGIAYYKTTKIEQQTEYDRLYGLDLTEGIRKSKDLVEKITAVCMSSDRDTLIDEATALAKQVRDSTVKLYISTADASKKLDGTENIHDAASDLIDLFATCLQTIGSIPQGLPVNQDNIQRGRTLLREAVSKIELIQKIESKIRSAYPKNKKKCRTTD